MLNSIKKHIDSKNAGFSLTELLVVIVMFGIITTALYNTYGTQSKISLAQQSILEMQSNGRAAIHLLSQSFSHAGFGSSDNTPGFFKFTNGTTDSIEIQYGYRYIANATVLNTDANTVIATTNRISSFPSTNLFINFFPSFSPNTRWEVKTVGLSTLTLEEAVSLVPPGAKIYQVFPVKFYVENGVLWQEDDSGKTAIAYDVAAFKMAYTTTSSNPISWETKSDSSIKNPKAVYISLILRTRDREPGFMQENNFKFPWSGTSQTLTNIEAGYHYQSFQAMVWIRNAE